MRTRILTRAERIDWLRLARTPGVGPVTFFELLNRFGGAEAALRALPTIAQRRARLGAVPARKAAEDEIARLESLGGRLLAAVDPEFSPLLGALTPPPPVLSALGDLSLLKRPGCAIVGSRNASAGGMQIARAMAQGLGESGYAVISGLARGIDAAAHRGALATGTIAVLAGGVDQIYPPENAELHREIAAAGLLLAENPLGAPPTARDFPRRNRVVTGLALGVVVVEAAAGSGSLISARTAAEQNREIMAVPGSPLDPRARGVNELIRNGATLVENADHVREALEPMREHTRLAEQDPRDYEPRRAADGFTAATPEALERLRRLLSPTPTSLDTLLAMSGLSPAAFTTALVTLELDGAAVTLPGGYATSVSE